jgi:hypothetical protein
MSYYYYENDSFVINKYKQNANPIVYNGYDYTITLNGSYNNLFNTKTFQYTNNSNNIIINFELNNDYFNNIFNQTFMETETNSQFNDTSYISSFNTRILEILALKIFGNAGARCAFSNDTQIINNLQNNLLNHVNKVIQNHKYDIYNQYDKNNIIINDINQKNIFNFYDSALAFPGLIQGKLSYPIIPKIVAGVSKVINGEYNIPILIKIYQEQIIYTTILMIVSDDEPNNIYYVAYQII